MPAALTNLWASSVAALIARIISHPMDTLKTRLQADPTVQFRTLRETVKYIYCSEGIWSFYRGLPVSLLFSVPALSVYLYSYDVAKDAISNLFNHLTQTSLLTHLTSAVIAESFSGFFWTPLELIKSRLQISQPGHYSPIPSTSSLSPIFPVSSEPFGGKQNKTLKIVKRIYNRDGLLGFLRGYWISLSVFVPFSAVYFILYEQMKAALGHFYSSSTADATKITLPFYLYLFSAAVCGAVAAAVSNPLDRIKTMVQVSDIEHQGKLNDVLKRLIQEEGWWKACTHGTLSRILWAVPNLCVSMTVYEMLKV